MSEYALTATAITRWQDRELPDAPQEQFDFWADLLDDFGPALLPFVLKPDYLQRIPYKRLGIAPIDVGDITPNQGECWLLFCFRGKVDRSRSPVRGDGFLLPCEWRCHPDPATGGHSPLLADSLTALADQVRQVLHGDDWHLFPSFSRFADKVAFSDPELFAPTDCPGLIASAWSSLATGLCFAQKGVVPHVWPFSSIQYDTESGKLMPVEGIVQKIAVAAAFRCRVFMVAPSQVNAARAELKTVATSATDPALRERLQAIAITAPVVSSGIAATVEDLATGTVTRKRRRTVCGAVCSFLAAAALVFGAWYYAMWIRPTTEYYATALRCRDGWEGRGRMTVVAAAKRVGNVRFTRDGLRGRVSEVAWVDGLSMPSTGYDFRSDFDDRLMLESGDEWRVRNVKFVLKREGGALAEELAYDAYGRETYRLRYLERGDPQFALYTKNRALYASEKHDAVQVSFAYDEKGREKAVRFLDSRRHPSVNIDGVCGYMTEYKDEEDAPAQPSVTRIFLATNNSPAYAKDGMAQIKSVFDGQWRLKHVHFLDERGQLILSSQGFAAVRYRHDAYGNPSSCVMMDVSANETAAPSPLGWAAQCQFEYSPDLRHRTVTAFLRRNDTLEPVRSVEIDVDENGYMKNRRVMLGASDIDDDPSVFGVRYERQGADSVAGRYLDAGGASCTNSSGVAGVRLTLDADGRVVERTYVASDGTPRNGRGGLATVLNTYDGDSLIRVEGFDTHGAPAGENGWPVRIVYGYDELKNLVSTEYFGTNGLPTLFGKTHSKEIRNCSRTRKLLELCFFLPDGTPATNANGCSRMVTDYEPFFDKPVNVSYWFGKERLVNTSLGYASVSNAYDDAGNHIYEAYRDASGRLVRTVGGFAVRKSRYNAENRRVELCYLDADERPVDDLSGRARYEAVYDILGHYRGEKAVDRLNAPRLPLVMLRFGDEEDGFRCGDILLACDQWRYVRESDLPVAQALTNGAVMTGMVFARKVGTEFRLVRCPGPFAFDSHVFGECCFPPQEEDAIVSLLPPEERCGRQ